MNNKLFKEFMTRKAAVHVNTQDEWEKFMELLEQETDIIWYGGREKPTELYWMFTVFGNSTVIYGGRYLMYGNKEDAKDSGYSVIEFSDLIAIPKPKKKNKDAPLTQNDKVITYMNTYNGITTLEAFKNLGVTRLSARIHDIRDMGYVVGDEFIKVIDRNGSETRVKMYWIINEPKKIEGE